MSPYVRNLLCIVVCSTCLGHAGCIMLPYAVYGAHTPLKNVSDREDLWGGFERDAVYELLIDVFMADYKHYSFGLALAPGKGVQTENRRGQWGGPTTAEAYRNDPERWPDIIGLVDAGTRLRCVELRRRTYLLHGKHMYTVFAELLDGPRAGHKVEITELSAFVDTDTWLLRPDKYLLEKVPE